MKAQEETAARLLPSLAALSCPSWSTSPESRTWPAGAAEASDREGFHCTLSWMTTMDSKQIVPWRFKVSLSNTCLILKKSVAVDGPLFILFIHRIKPRASHIRGEGSTAESHPSPNNFLYNSFYYSLRFFTVQNQEDKYNKEAQISNSLAIQH